MTHWAVCAEAPAEKARKANRSTRAINRRRILDLVEGKVEVKRKVIILLLLISVCGRGGFSRQMTKSYAPVTFADPPLRLSFAERARGALNVHSVAARGSGTHRMLRFFERFLCNCPSAHTLRHHQKQFPNETNKTELRRERPWISPPAFKGRSCGRIMITLRLLRAFDAPPLASTMRSFPKRPFDASTKRASRFPGKPLLIEISSPLRYS